MVCGAELFTAMLIVYSETHSFAVVTLMLVAAFYFPLAFSLNFLYITKIKIYE